MDEDATNLACWHEGVVVKNARARNAHQNKQASKRRRAGNAKIRHLSIGFVPYNRSNLSTSHHVHLSILGSANVGWRVYHFGYRDSSDG